MNPPIEEPQEEDNLFYLCSLIDYIARKTKNRRRDVVSRMGKETLAHYFEFADVYHCENLDKIRDEIIEKCAVPAGNFDNVLYIKNII